MRHEIYHDIDWNKIEDKAKKIKLVQRCESLDEILRHLQNRARTALFFFVNSDFWLEDTFSITDIFSKRERATVNCIAGMQSYIFDLEKKYGHFIATSRFLRNHRKNLSLNDTAVFFSIFYEEFNKIISLLGKGKMVKIENVDLLDISAYPNEDREYLLPLNYLKDSSERNMKGLLVGLYLHGSLATHDYIPNWSDVDTLMIIRRDTILSPQRLLLLRKYTMESQVFFYQIDPLQLHGHLVISEFDIDYYPEPYFPLILFKYAKSFWDHKPIDFKLRDSSLERLLIFWSDAVYWFFLRAIEFKNSKRRSVLSNRAKKLFLHRLMTFPMFYLQAMGNYNYKKFTFERAREDFPEALWNVIEIATGMMKNWSYLYKANRNMASIAQFDIKTYFWVITKFYNIRDRLIKGVQREFEEDYTKLLSASVNLAIKGWENIESKIG